jgi:hypothetical protein
MLTVNSTAIQRLRVATPHPFAAGDRNHRRSLRSRLQAAIAAKVAVTVDQQLRVTSTADRWSNCGLPDSAD